MFNADRQLKFPFTGPVTEDTGWPWKALAASLLALIPMIWFGRRFSRFKLMGRFFFAALIQLACGLVVWSATLPFNFYLSWVDWTMLTLLFPAQIAILAILLINGFEFTEVLWRRGWIRHGGMLRPDMPGEAAVRVDPPGLLQRAAGDGASSRSTRWPRSTTTTSKCW